MLAVSRPPSWSSGTGGWLESRDALLEHGPWGPPSRTGFIALLPWALFFVPRMAMRTESNAVSGLVLLGYAAVDMGLASYCCGGHLSPGQSRWQVVLLIVGFLLAAAAHSVVCEFLAQQSKIPVGTVRSGRAAGRSANASAAPGPRVEGWRR